MNTIRVALPGYNAETDTNPDHFALYSDEDWVLIKEFTRGGVVLGNGGVTGIWHRLGYVPYFLVYVYDKNYRGEANVVANKWKLVGANYPSAFNASATDSRLYIKNNDPGLTTFSYYIFYDQQV